MAEEEVTLLDELLQENDSMTLSIIKVVEFHNKEGEILYGFLIVKE